MSKQKFYLTTPIYYVNARPHIGHAYTTLVADTIARRHRLLGHDTFFLTGTDEHGQKIERSAAAAGIPPQQFTDEVSAEFRNLWARMGLTNDDFIRTTEPRHQQGAQRLFALLHQRGQIYLSSYTGQYSIGEEIFVEGPPGVLGPDGKPTETVTEENFFFRLSEYQLPLLDLIESDTLLIQPESRKNEVLSFLRGNVQEFIVEYIDKKLNKSPRESVVTMATTNESDRETALQEAAIDGKVRFSNAGKSYVPGALRDLSVSRSSFTWGIPVPEPAASETKQKHVIYVWLDALANYMTAVGYGSDDPEKIEQFEKYWPADVHIMAKEITRQHCIYWPAFLLALNPKLQHNPGEPTPKLSPEEHRAWAEKMLPKAVVAHGWLLFDDSKMSKSKGNIVRSETILDAFGTLCPPAPSPSLLSSAAAPFLSSPSPVLSSTSPFLSSRSEAEGSAVSPDEPQPPTKHEQDLFAADVLRYFLLREVPFGQDGSFSFEALITRYNADLANGYGNLVSRTLKLIEQNMPNGIEAPQLPWKYPSTPWERTNPENATPWMIQQVEEFIADTYSYSWPNHRYEVLLAGLMHRLGLVDGYISYHKPWNLAKSTEADSRDKLVEVLYTAAEAIRIFTALLHPILPYATAQVWKQLGFEKNIEAAAKSGDLKNLEWGGLKPGTKLGRLSPIFPRADKGLAQIMTDMESTNTPKPTPSKLVDEKTVNTEPASTNTTHPGAAPRTSALNEENPGAQVGGAAAPGPELIKTPPHTESPASAAFANASAASTTPDTPQISIDDFVKIDLRVAQILVAERIPKADKLLRLEVDLGYEKRQILSGIAEWYTPEELIGRRIVVITNLAPRKMRGLESHGMLLAASAGENGKPILATFTEDIPLGSRLR